MKWRKITSKKLPPINKKVLLLGHNYFDTPRSRERFFCGGLENYVVWDTHKNLKFDWYRKNGYVYYIVLPPKKYE